MYSKHMEFCSMICGRLDGRGVWGRMDTCICMAESLHGSPETIKILLTSYTPIQNKKFFKKKLMIQRLFYIFSNVLIEVK